jgi:hypothetical protein
MCSRHNHYSGNQIAEDEIGGIGLCGMYSEGETWSQSFHGKTEYTRTSFWGPKCRWAGKTKLTQTNTARGLDSSGS